MEGDHSPILRRYVSEELHHATREQAALVEMAYLLSSSNVVGDHEDDGSTRREAKLLMSLSALPQSPNQSDLDLLLSSESDSSYVSDSSRCSESFSIVCPSLSLEHAPSSALQHAYREKRNLKRRSEDAADYSPAPATLLGRPLKADDRNAVRLSADAMALNVCDSFRKALQWRVNTWTESLSKSIAAKEKAMVAKGARDEDLKILLSSSEATLILNLNVIEDRIKLTSTRTSVNLLPQRVDKDREPSNKKRRILPRDQLEESEYQYSVAHAVRFECVVELETPAGYAEVALEVPGTLEGTFFSHGIDQEELTAVTLDINTDMLATMVEKACRKIVRVSVESMLKEGSFSLKEKERDESPRTASFAPKTSSSERDPSKLIYEFSTPPPSSTKTVSAADVRAALVSPQGDVMSGSSSGFLSPIPDDFDSFPPPRISSHLHSSDNKRAFSSPLNIAPLTPWCPITEGASVLVSPTPQTPGERYKKSTTKGPSLPVLVEVACREYHND